MRRAEGLVQLASLEAAEHLVQTSLGSTSCRCWVHDDLQALIELLIEHLVGVGGVGERGLVGDDEGGVQLARLDVPQQLIPVLWPVHHAGVGCMTTFRHLSSFSLNIL